MSKVLQQLDVDVYDGFKISMLQLPAMAFKTEKYPSSNAIFIWNSLAIDSKGIY